MVALRPIIAVQQKRVEIVQAVVVALSVMGKAKSDAVIVVEEESIDVQVVEAVAGAQIISVILAGEVVRKIAEIAMEKDSSGALLVMEVETVSVAVDMEKSLVEDAKVRGSTSNTSNTQPIIAFASSVIPALLLN